MLNLQESNSSPFAPKEGPFSIAHSPDADDRFMFWPLKEGLIDAEGFAFNFLELPTGDLNARSLLRGEAPHVCAISAAHYLRVHTVYQPLKMGSSVGMNYGPVVISHPGIVSDRSHCKNFKFLSPGCSTTAHGVARLLDLVGTDVEEVSISPMERVFERLEQLRAQSVPAVALLIHEGRLSYQSRGYELLSDLGRDWFSLHGQSLVLGINVIRRDLDLSIRQKLAALFQKSYDFAQKNRNQFIAESQLKDSPYYSPLNPTEMDHYLDLYANSTTRCISSTDAQSFEFLLNSLSGSEQESPKFDWI